MLAKKQTMPTVTSSNALDRIFELGRLVAGTFLFLCGSVLWLRVELLHVAVCISTVKECKWIVAIVTIIAIVLNASHYGASKVEFKLACVARVAYTCGARVAYTDGEKKQT